MLKAHRRRVERGLTTEDMSIMSHMVFIGSSGTGKTMMARLVARMLHHIGLLSKGHVLEVASKDLIAGHCGQTGPKTFAACEKAFGGVLFIDEAYSINPKGDSAFGRECVDTLVKVMEDHREKFVVIMAGYPECMEEFMETNPGLKSRFNARFMFYFDDYTTEELAEIFVLELSKRHYHLDEGLEDRLPQLITQYTTQDARARQNGRLMRTLVENCIANQNRRWVHLDDNEVSDTDMVTVKEEDFVATGYAPKDPLDPWAVVKIGRLPEDPGTDASPKPEETPSWAHLL
uniref:AAA+ ATPase domain-containing protein n=1 Tax=Eutreptiella gymnastica TaxID=73025 RepID=A0A7S1IVD5_9EUGL